MELDFGQSGFLAFWNSLGYDGRAKLIENLKAYSALLDSLKRQGKIEAPEHSSEMYYVKMTPDIKELQELAKKTGGQGLKFVKVKKINTP
jgi:hypothetical protein